MSDLGHWLVACLRGAKRGKEVACVPTHTPNQLWTVSGATDRPGADASGCQCNHNGRTMVDRLLNWADLADGSRWDTLVIGNGLSINIWNDFAYSRLFERASLKPAARQLFSDFQTQNFEMVLEALWHAERTLTALGRRTAAITALYEHVQSALFQAVLKVHVPWTRIDRSALERISEAMSLHRFVFTLNYDLLTYWSAMVSGPTSAIRDFFWSQHNTFDINNATLEEGGTGLFYVHGGVHLWRDSKSGRTGKWTKRSGGALLTRLEADFRSLPSRRPLLVSEGTSAQKMAVIRRSDYLTYALQALSENMTDTVIFGASFADQDAHIIGAIASGRQRRIAISIHPGTRAQNDTAMAKYRARFPEHRLAFFDSTSHPLGDPSLSVR